MLSGLIVMIGRRGPMVVATLQPWAEISKRLRRNLAESVNAFGEWARIGECLRRNGLESTR